MLIWKLIPGPGVFADVTVVNEEGSLIEPALLIFTQLLHHPIVTFYIFQTESQGLRQHLLPLWDN